jgi:SAM-dependent methyltransferase
MSLADALIDSDLSAFYTPATTAACLASWAIRTGDERVLEPSFGGGALINAAVERAQSLDSTASLKLVGFDLDQNAVKALNPAYGGLPIDLIWQDFLAVDSAEHGLFDVVLSNPPFTRNHSIPPVRRYELRKRFQTTGAAGIWVHFILHSIQFLRPGGRLACVVPASCFFADYATDLLNRLCKAFEHVELLRLNEKPEWSGGAQEAGAFLLADGYRLGSCSAVSRGFWIQGRGQVSDFDPVSPAFAELTLAARPFSEIADIGIGDVTGCNRVFLLSNNDRKSAGIPLSQVSPIVSRARQIRGLVLTKRELAEVANQGEKTWLLSPTNLDRSNMAVRRRLAGISSHCSIARSSGSPLLDSTTCRVMRDRAGFIAATAPNSLPMTSNIEQEVTWTPTGVKVPGPSGSLRAELDVYSLETNTVRTIKRFESMSLCRSELGRMAEKGPADGYESFCFEEPPASFRPASS